MHRGAAKLGFVMVLLLAPGAPVAAGEPAPTRGGDASPQVPLTAEEAWHTSNRTQGAGEAPPVVNRASSDEAAKATPSPHAEPTALERATSGADETTEPAATPDAAASAEEAPASTPAVDKDEAASDSVHADRARAPEERDPDQRGSAPRAQADADKDAGAAETTVEAGPRKVQPNAGGDEPEAKQATGARANDGEPAPSQHDERSQADEESSQHGKAAAGDAAATDAVEAPAVDATEAEAPSETTGEKQAPDTAASDGRGAGHEPEAGDGDAATPPAEETSSPEEHAEKKLENPESTASGGSWYSSILSAVGLGGGEAKPVEPQTGEEQKGEPQTGEVSGGEHQASEGEEGAPKTRVSPDETAEPSHDGAADAEPAHAADEHAVGGDASRHEGEASSFEDGEHAAEKDETETTDHAGAASAADAHGVAADAHAEPKAESGGFMSSLLGMVGLGGGESKPEAAEAHGGGGETAAEHGDAKGEHGEASDTSAEHGGNGEHGAAKTAEDRATDEHAAATGEHGKAADAHAEPKAESGGFMSSLLGMVGLGGGESKPAAAEAHGGGGEAAAEHGDAKDEHGETASEHGDGKGEHGEASDTTAEHGGNGEHGAAKTAEDHATDEHAAAAGEHGKTADAHAEPKAESGGFMSSLLGMVGLGGSKTADAHGDKKADGHGGDAASGEAKGEHGEAAAEGGHGGEHGTEEAAHGDEKPPPPPMWPKTPAVEDASQPYILVRTLRSVQDQVASGSVQAFNTQKRLIRDFSEQMRALPPEVWDDTRNVRAAVYYVLTGGDPRVLTVVAGHDTPIYVPRRLIKGALAFGEGRQVEAASFLDPIKPRDLDPSLAGIVALIKGTLVAKKDSKAALALFDDARLLSPGTLIEESALRQQLLVLAREGDLERFDQLASQYWRRFEKSLFGRTFRRQFLAGVARQSFPGGSAWIARAETEMQKLAQAERPGVYLSIAQEAVKGGHIDVVKFATAKAETLYRDGSLERQRADLYLAAVLVATDEAQRGVGLLQRVVPEQLAAQDREIYDAAASVGREVLRQPVTAQETSETPPESVSRAKEMLSSVDALFEGGTK